MNWRLFRLTKHPSRLCIACHSQRDCLSVPLCSYPFHSLTPSVHHALRPRRIHLGSRRSPRRKSSWRVRASRALHHTRLLPACQCAHSTIAPRRAASHRVQSPRRAHGGGCCCQGRRSAARVRLESNTTITTAAGFQLSRTGFDGRPTFNANDVRTATFVYVLSTLLPARARRRRPT